MTGTTEKVWLDYDQEALDNQYNQAYLVPNIQEYQETNARESARVRETLDCRLNIPYGPSADELLDVFPAPTPGAPVVVLSMAARGRVRTRISPATRPRPSSGPARTTWRSISVWSPA